MSQSHNIYQIQMEARHPQTSTSHRKVFDTIYGFISFPKQIWEFIDTRHVQRLRNIKQLGCLSWVFPGAMHSRFEHSLGTGHLAQKYITTLIWKHKDRTINQDVYRAYHGQIEEDKYKSTIDEAIFIITLAGILHDVGHGPFSHLFDSKVVKKVNGKDWQHEIASLCLIDAIYKEVIGAKNQVSQKKEIQWLESTKDRVKALIIGKITKAKYRTIQDGQYVYDRDVEVGNLQEGFNQKFKKEIKKRPWEFQLISNRLTGIDVDKLDYFRRDAFYVGAKNIYIDHELLMNQTLILKEPLCKQLENSWDQASRVHRLCYPTKYFDKVFDIYFSRYKLYKTYYLNLKANGVDFMLAQILKQAEPKFGFKRACELLLEGNCQKYIKLTDSVVERIGDAYDEVKQRLQDPQNPLPEAQLTQIQKGILRAGRLLDKLKRREIFDFVKEYQKSFPFEKIGSYKKVTEKLKEKLEEQSARLGNVVLNQAELGFGIKDKNPFSQCRFYDKTKPIKTMQFVDQKKFFSMLKPNGIIEISIRLYLKNRSKNPTPEQTQRIEEIIEEIRTAVHSIDREFDEGQSGTFTNRPPTIPIVQNGEQMVMMENLGHNQDVDREI